MPSHAVADAVADDPTSSVATQPAQSSFETAHEQPAQIPSPFPGVGLTEIHRFIEQGKYADAEAELRALSSDTLTDPAVRMNGSTLWNDLGVRLAKVGGTTAAISAYKIAAAINPRNAQAYMSLVLAYWETKDAALTPAMLDEAARLRRVTRCPISSWRNGLLRRMISRTPPYILSARRGIVQSTCLFQ